MGELSTQEERRIAERRYRVALCVRDGIRQQTKIAEIVGVSVPTVKSDLLALDEMWTMDGRSLVGQQRDRERAISSFRIEEYITRALKEVNDPDPEIRIKALRLLKEFEEQRARLLGLNMPTKTALTDPSGEQEYRGIPDHIKQRFLDEAPITVEAEVVDDGEHNAPGREVD